MTTRMRVAKIPKEELVRRCEEGTMYADFVPIGHWIPKCDHDGVPVDENTPADVFECSECHEIVEQTEYSSKGDEYNFCPFCGADMRENIE